VFSLNSLGAKIISSTHVSSSYKTFLIPFISLETSNGNM
jgi:hypothetical protein